ncbi:MAG TPA: hypothetical protein ENH28_05960 [Euryarchaeota archaeon]|nr:hypothetical protein BMS3Bbin15_01169 [archaeon BMS3Bbin15]HDL15677.1 hypothetical protein [Euryarchaeota archaeon]
MNRKAVAILDSSVKGEFGDFCVDWIKRHYKKQIDIKMTLLYLRNSEGQKGADNILKNAVHTLEEKGISAETEVTNSISELKEEIKHINPETVFIGSDKISKQIDKKIPGALVKYRGSKRKEIKYILAYGIAALLIYSTIFYFFNSMQELTTGGNILSVILILGTVIAVAYFYGNAISHILRYLGISHGH